MSFYTKQLSLNNKKNLFDLLGQLPSFLVIGMITLYQWTLSPDHGILSLYNTGVCKHAPTCSEFTKEQVKKQGVLKGLKKGFNQIRKCY